MARKDKYGQIGKPRVDSATERHLNGISKLSGRSRSSRIALRSIAFGFVVLLIAVTLAITSGVINNRRTSDALQQISQENYNPTFKVRYNDLGERIVRNWYTGGIQPVPMGANLQWPGQTPTNIGGFGDQATPTSNAPAGTEEAKNIPKIDDVIFYSGERHDAEFKPDGTTEGHIESLTYLIVMNGKQYLSSITLNVLEDQSSPDAEKPVLTSAPTLTPYIIFLAEPNKKVSNEPTDLAKVEDKPNEQTMTAITSFVEAWTSNDSVRIKQLVQDSDPDNIYYGLGSGWTFDGSDVAINWNRVGLVGTERLTVMNISFQINSKGEAPTNKETGEPDESLRPRYSVTQSLDIVIDGYNSSLPAIKAWGPSGSWPTLDPYSNAVSAKELSKENLGGTPSQEESTESPAPSGSTAPSVSPSATPSPSSTEQKKEEK